MITFRTRPINTDFTTLADVKEALSITGSDDDDFLSNLIERASDEIVQFTRRDFARAAVTDDVVSMGRRRLLLFYPPILVIEAVRLRDTVLDDITDIRIINADAGIVARDKVFESTQAHRADLTVQPINYQDLPDWSFDYTGGFLMPGDNIISDTTISASSVDNSFNTTGKFPLLVAGDVLKNVSGFVDSSLSGDFVVVSRTDTKIITSSTLATEAAGPAINMTVETLPKSLQHAAIEIVTSLFDARARSRGIKAESLGDHSTTYVDGGGVIPKSTERSLTRWASMI